ncbi:MAG: hypothetical protein EAX90_09050 [Candidatus Heimdallarchaeota archaeon]|nr:hypothetical protein [Candidatus Heimdallarchaeota archaeon]
MNVKIMKMIVEPFENGEHTIAHDLLKYWKRDNDILKQGRSSANFIFGFYLDENLEILRISPGTERTRNQLLAEIDFIHHLSKNNIPVATPIISKSNNFVETEKVGNIEFHAVAFHLMPGKHIEFEDMNSYQLFHFGEMIAKFHEASKKFIPEKNRTRRDWNIDITNAIAWLRSKNPLIENNLLKMKNWMNTLELNKENYGLIHYDFCSDNILWVDNSFSIIDLDDAAYYPFTAEFAFGIDEFREFSSNTQNKVLENVIEGYKSIRNISENWEYEFKQFMNLMDLLKYARLTRSYQDTNPDEDLQWMKEMRKRHMVSLENDYTRIKENFR